MQKKPSADEQGGFTQQVTIVLPKHCVHKLDSVSCKTGARRHYIIWDALGNFLMQFDGGGERSGGRA